MSQTEWFKGTIKKINLWDKTAEQWAEDYCKKAGIEKASYTSNWVEQLIDEEHDKIIRFNSDLYETIEKYKVDEEDDIMFAEENKDWTVNFEVKYYNGWCGFEEAIQKAIEDNIIIKETTNSNIELLKTADSEYEQNMNFYEKINELAKAINILTSDKHE